MPSLLLASTLLLLRDTLWSRFSHYPPLGRFPRSPIVSWVVCKARLLCDPKAPCDTWHRTQWTLYKTTNRVAEVRLTWPFSEIGGCAPNPLKCIEANVGQEHYFIKQILSSWSPISPRETQRFLETAFRMFMNYNCVSSLNLTRSIWKKPSPKAISIITIYI